MKAYVFVEEGLKFALEGDEKSIDKYMSAMQHGAEFYAGYGIQHIIQTDSGFEHPDTIDPVPDELVEQIKSDRGVGIRVLQV